VKISRRCLIQRKGTRDASCICTNQYLELFLPQHQPTLCLPRICRDPWRWPGVPSGLPWDTFHWLTCSSRSDSSMETETPFSNPPSETSEPLNELVGKRHGQRHEKNKIQNRILNAYFSCACLVCIPLVSDCHLRKWFGCDESFRFDPHTCVYHWPGGGSRFANRSISVPCGYMSVVVFAASSAYLQL